MAINILIPQAIFEDIYKDKTDFRQNIQIPLKHTCNNLYFVLSFAYCNNDSEVFILKLIVTFGTSKSGGRRSSGKSSSSLPNHLIPFSLIFSSMLGLELNFLTIFPVEYNHNPIPKRTTAETIPKQIPVPAITAPPIVTSGL